MTDDQFFRVQPEDVDWLNMSVDPAQAFSANGAVNLDPHTWHPINLAQRALEPPEPPSINEIIYPGRCHVWSGEPETLKSMVAMAVCLDQIRAGKHTAYIDYENGAREATARMRSLGATDDDLARFLYYEPAEPLTGDTEIYGAVNAQFAACEPTVVVVDSYTGSLATHQCSPNEALDVERHHQTVIKPLMAHGASTIILDHLVKNREMRGRYAIGSERKIGVADIHIGFEIILPLSRGHHGVVRLRVHKDRPGYLQRPITAQARFESTLDGELTWQIEPAHTEPDADITAFRPTVLMERVSRYLELHGEPASMNTLEDTVQGKAGYIRKAVDALVQDGYAVERKGPRGARLIDLAKSYRADNDPLPEQAQNEADLVPTSSLPPRPTSSLDLVPPIPLEQADSTTSSPPRPTSSPHSDTTSSLDALSPTGGASRAGRGHRCTEPEENPDPNDIEWGHQ